MSTATLQVSGLHCPSCSMLVTMNVEELPGVSAVDCDHATGKTVVTFDESTTDLESIRQTIVAAGYGVESAAE